MLVLLRAVSFLPMVVGAKIRREERRAIERLRAAHALDAVHAVPPRSNGMIARWVHDRLVRNHVIAAGNGGEYLDEAAYETYRQRRRRVALTILLLMMVGLLIAVASGVLRND